MFWHFRIYCFLNKFIIGSFILWIEDPHKRMDLPATPFLKFFFHNGTSSVILFISYGKALATSTGLLFNRWYLSWCCSMNFKGILRKTQFHFCLLIYIVSHFILIRNILFTSTLRLSLNFNIRKLRYVLTWKTLYKIY